MEKLCDTCLYGIRVEDNKLGCLYSGICHTSHGEKTAWAIKSAIRKAVDERKEKTWYDFHGIAYEEMDEFLGDKYVTIPKDGYKHLLRCKEELAELLRNANRRRKSAERKLRKMRDTMHLINDDAMKSISSRQRTIEGQWEVMRELQRRGLVSTEDLEAVLKDVAHVVRFRFNTTENKH